MPVAPARAIDPLYQEDMRRLVEIMGSLYFLQPLCDAVSADWRAEAADLIARDAPDPDRETAPVRRLQRGLRSLCGGLYRFCTPAAREAMLRLIDEADESTAKRHPLALRRIKFIPSPA